MSTYELYAPISARLPVSTPVADRREMVKRSEDLRAALFQAIKNKRPCVIDVHVDAEVRPPSTGTWQLPPIPFKEPVFGKPYRP